MTTWAALVDHAKLSPSNAAGKKVLVHAGSGGIGTFTIQLLKAWGCYVATTCSTRNIELVKSLGADEVIDYTKNDFSQVLKNYDVVYDTIGFKVDGNEEKSISILKKNAGAVYVSIVHPMVSIITDNGLLLGLAKVAITLIGKKIKNRNISYQWSIFKPNGNALKQVSQHIEAGEIKAVIDRTYALDKIAEAHKYIAAGRTRGKVVITI
jgi:reticulon-4-interacting protein 1, mitochondrial